MAAKIKEGKDIFPVIMAGGSGTRFWPRSREKRSKQFLSILQKKSLIEATLRRFQTMVENENILIVTREEQKTELVKHIDHVPEENILFEPVGRNTAPCIGLAALHVRKKNPDGVMIVTPADHLIRKEIKFRKSMEAAVSLARENEVVVTLGIYPDRPSTGYGYIQIDQNLVLVNGIETYTVKTFAEKPNLATAERFLESGDFYWNSGIFAFKASHILSLVETCMPELYDELMEIDQSIGTNKYKKTVENVYKDMKSISIDYGIMEKTKNVCMVNGAFGWNDLGSWEQIYKLSLKDKNGNAVNGDGDVVLLDTKNSYVYNSDGLIAVLGLEDIIVVQDAGAMLICKRDRAEEVKSIVNRIKRNKLQRYL